MNKLLVILAIAVTMVVANPAHKGGAKHLNKGSAHSNLKGANSVVKPNKIKKNNDILDLDKAGNKMERKVKKQAIKAVL